MVAPKGAWLARSRPTFSIKSNTTATTQNTAIMKKNVVRNFFAM